MLKNGTFVVGLFIVNDLGYVFQVRVGKGLNMNIG
jgi:hypothetical protein